MNTRRNSPRRKMFHQNNMEFGNRYVVSITRAIKGLKTQWHYLKDTAESYVIILGKGFMELGEGFSRDVETGDAVIIHRVARSG